jgi:hypothetical protein
MSGADFAVSGRVIVIPATDAGAAPSARSPGSAAGASLSGLAALLAAAVVLMQSLAADAVQAGWALKSFPFWWGGKSEASRLFEKNWPSLEAAEGIAEIVPAGEKTLVFRQAEVAFYTRAHYVFFFDAAVSPIFIMTDASAAAAALIDKDVRWIAAPDYAMPEIDNSAIGAILADPALATLVRDFGGFRLFRVHGEAAPVDLAPAAEERFTTAAPADLSWRVVTLAGGAPGDHRIRSAPDGRLAAITPHALFGAGGEALQIERWRPSDAATQRFFVDLAPGAPVYDISADLEGRGRAEIVLQTVRNDADTRDAGGPPPETLVWRGVLLGERRTVSGQVRVPAADLSDTSLIGYRLAIRLRGPGRLAFGGWRADALRRRTSAGAPSRSGLEDAGARAAWTIEAGASAATAVDSLRDEPGGGAAFRLGPRETAEIAGPWMIEAGLAGRLRGARPGAPADEAAIETLAGALDFEPYEVSARFSLSGRGVAGVRIIARCADGEERAAALETIRLSPEAGEHMIRTRLKCRPALARLALFAFGPPSEAESAAPFRIGPPELRLKAPGAAATIAFEPAREALPELAAGPAASDR